MINKLYPGLPDYEGPTSGSFTLLHHNGPLIEWSDDVMERIKHIKTKKKESERPIRLKHIVYVPKGMIPKSVQKADAEWRKADAEWQKAEAEWQKAEAEWRKAEAEWRKAEAEWRKADAEWGKAEAKRQKAEAEWGKAEAKRQKAEAEWRKADADKLTAYLHKHVKDCRWNGKEIVFP